MTGNTNKTRAVILAALMVFSVFAGTVAFSGSAAADGEYAGNAVEYQNDSGYWVIEVPIENGEVTSAEATAKNFSLLDDGDNVTDESVSDVYYSSSTGAVYLNLTERVSSNDLEVDIKDASGLDNTGEKSVVFAGQTREFNATAGTSPDNASAYQGSTVAINLTDDATDTDVTIEGEDNNYFREGSTGTNSTVYTFDTSDRELGEYRAFIQSNDTAANRTFVTIRDLQLDVSLDDLNVSDEETIEGDVSAVAGGRNVDVDLLDSSDDSVNLTNTDLDGQGDIDFEFDALTADNGSQLDTGTYTIEVTDTTSGVSVESSELEINEAADEEANFQSGTYTQERGDIIEFTVELSETDEATVNFGSDDDGVEANVTVEDDDDDDQVTVYLNTYQTDNALPGSSGANVFYLDDDSDDNIVDQSLDQQPNGELIEAGDYDLEVQAGDLDNGPGAVGANVGLESSDDVATVTLTDRSSENIRMWTGSSDEIGAVSDLEDVNEALSEGQIIQSSEVAVGDNNGDYAVHQLEASGLEGALNAREDEDVTGAFFTLLGTDLANLTVEEADPGANQNADELKLSQDNTTVIADGANDTYFVVVETGNVNFENSGAIPSDDDTQLEANFTINDNDATGHDFVTEDELDSDENEEVTATFTAAEVDVNVDEPFNVSQASGQTVSGDTNIAPGTELNLRVRSQDGVSPSFLKTASPVIQSDGTFSATFDFSEQNVGDEYDIIVQDPLRSSDEEEEGQVVEAVATDTATPEPTDTDTATPEPTDTDTATPEPTDTATEMPTDEPTDTPTSTPTSTPGFGVIVALTALLAAALLAVRRNN